MKGLKEMSDMKFRRMHLQLPPDVPALEIVDLVIQLERDHQQRSPGPMLTATVVDERTGLPDPRWFDLARELGRLQPGEDEKEFWVREMHAVHVKYRGRPPRSTNNGRV
jgi:hypothetical protein